MTEKRITLVTGASRGIGRALSVELAVQRNNHVLAIARSKTALEQLDDEIKSKGGSCTLIPMDITDGQGIEQLSAVVLERWGRLDALAGNAGVLGPISPIHTVTPHAFEATINTNLTANWRLVRSFDPLLRISDAGRAVFVTSGVVPRPRAFWGPYQASKAALESMAIAWAEETSVTNLKVNLFDPGGTRTDMRADAMPGEDPMILPSPEDVAKRFAELLLPDCQTSGHRYSYREM